jgi:hypothetical protein
MAESNPNPMTEMSPATNPAVTAMAPSATL